MSVLVTVLGAGCASHWQTAPLEESTSRGVVRYQTKPQPGDSAFGRLEVKLECRDFVNSTAGKVTLLARDSVGNDTYPAELPLGQYVFAEVIPGRYRLWSQHVGCWSNRAWITVHTRTVTRVRVQLEPANIEIQEADV